MINELADVFLKFDIFYIDVINKLIEIGKEKYTEQLDSTKMPPIHYNHCYFAMASLILEDAKNILEIGTGPGRSTAVLAQLFPNAKAYTLDVPDGDPYYKKSWQGRNNGQFQKEILRNTKFENVIRLKINSSNIHNIANGFPEKFDLILVDGCHVSPIVDWDIGYAYGALAKNGFLFMHDYELHKKTDNDVHKVVEQLRLRIKEKIWLLPEYADPKWSNGKMACIIGGKNG